MSDSRKSSSNEQSQSGMKNQSCFRESNQSEIIDRQSTNLTILSSQITSNKEDDDLICPVCSNLIWEPIECSTCKLHVCLKCIQDWLRKGNTTCPISGCVDCFDEKPHPYFYKHLSNVKISCQNEPNGCKVISNYEQYQKHLDQECEYVLVVCSNEGCGEKILKKLMEDHDKICSWKLIQCELCDEFVVRSAMKNHIDLECQNVKVKCPNCSAEEPNECCQELVQRKLLTEHMKTCLFRTVECQHCHTKMTFQQLSSHEQNCQFKMCVCIGCGAGMYKSFIADHEAECKEIKGHCDKCGSSWAICEETHDEIKCLKIILEQTQQKGRELKMENETIRESFKSLQQKIQSSLELCIPNNNQQEIQFQQNQKIQEAYARIFQILKDYQFILHQNQKKHGFFPKSAKEALQHFQFLESTAVLYKGWHSIHCGDCLKLVERIRPVIQPYLKIIADASFELTEINKSIAREGSQMQEERIENGRNEVDQRQNVLIKQQMKK